MFARTREPTLLEHEIDSAIRSLSSHQMNSAEYVKTLDIVTKLHTLKEREKPSSVSKDTLAIVIANLLGIILIIKHEEANVIVSRAMNLVIKPKL